MHRAGLPAGVAAAAAALVCTGTASADRPRVAFTKPDQQAAKAATLQRSDLDSTKSWRGGATPPDLSSGFTCATYRPKQSDLVLTGAAASSWSATGIQVLSQVQILETPAMVRLDWQRTVLAPEVLPCGRATLAKSFGPGVRLVSFATVPFPRVGAYTRVFRAVLILRGTSVIVDAVLFGRNRTEMGLTAIVEGAAASSIRTIEIRLAEAMLARASR